MRSQSCRDAILEVAPRDRSFALEEIVQRLRNRGATFKEATIRTHVTSRMCANAPDNHGVTYDDFTRVARGTYEVRAKGANKTLASECCPS